MGGSHARRRVGTGSHPSPGRTPRTVTCEMETVTGSSASDGGS